MPGFWTSDLPLGQIGVRIQPAKAPLSNHTASEADAISRSYDSILYVPESVYSSLEAVNKRRRSLAKSKSINEPLAKGNQEIYATIKTSGCRAQDKCSSLVALVIKRKDLGNSKSIDERALCVADRETWAHLTGSDGATESDLLLEDEIDSEKSLNALLEAIEPIELTEVVFGVAAAQYDDALLLQNQVSEYLSSKNRLYRNSVCMDATITREDGTKATISLQCLMCQPVSQGIIHKGNTDARVIFVKDSSKPKSSLAHSLADSLQTTLADSKHVSDPELWDDLGVEWFIMGGAISLDNNGHGKIMGSLFDSNTLFEPGIDFFQDSANGSLGLNDTEKALQNTEKTKAHFNFKAIELSAPVDVSRIIPPPEPKEDTDNRGYLSLAGLAKLGITSGSWVSISSCPMKEGENTTTQSDAVPVKPAENNSSWRAIRVFAHEDILSNDTIAFAPLLLHNITKSSRKGSGLQKASISVSVLPLGSPPESSSPFFNKSSDSTTTALEVARKVVIARVSSPLSERRDLESHALAALQNWVSPAGQSPAPLRVVKEGDLISVRIILADATVRTKVALVAGSEAATRLRNGDASIDSESVDVNPVSDIDLVSGSSQDADNQFKTKSSENEIVFYRVMSAIPFKIADDAASSDESGDGGSEYDEEENDFNEGGNGSDYEIDPEEFDNVADREWYLWYCRVKGMGVVIQPDITMVSQIGAVHSHVPYSSMRSYISAGVDGFNYTDIKDNSSDEVEEPYADVLGQLMRLANASLHPLAISRKLVCSALLKGNPGTGKRHMVRRVAEQLGVHLYELSCYEILSDTEEKTAQALQVYFQNASRYTPCILHLRSIEALAQASNAPPGQENGDDLPISRVLKTCIDNVSRVHYESGFPILIVATSNDPEKIPNSLAAAFRHELELTVPDENTRTQLLTNIAKANIPLAPDADLGYISQQTASFVARDLEILFKRAANRAWRRARDSLKSDSDESEGIFHFKTRDLLASGQVITNDDLIGALGDARASMSDTLGVPKIPNVKWDDVGGLADAKKDILDTIRLPMEQPHLFASGLNTRSGLLFYGPPGTGKTLLAKAIATECGLNFFSCKGPELISPYIGESEANVRRIFQKAREASPCVIFFDELDSLAPKRGQQGDSGGVMDRIVSQLLAELDGMSGSSDSGDNDESNSDSSSADSDTKKSPSAAAATQVFAIGATNRPDLLDPALLRPGRFDKLVYLGVSETHDAQLNIIQALTRKFHLHPDLDLKKIADSCPFHYTGADFYALCSDALLKAMLRTVDEVDVLIKEWNEGKHDEAGAVSQESETSTNPTEKSQSQHHPIPMTPQYYLDHIATDDVKQVTVTIGDFEKAFDELIPSVSADELVRYQALRRQFDSTLKNAKADNKSDDNSIGGQNSLPLSQVPSPKVPDPISSLSTINEQDEDMPLSRNIGSRIPVSSNANVSTNATNKGKSPDLALTPPALVSSPSSFEKPVTPTTPKQLAYSPSLGSSPTKIVRRSSSSTIESSSPSSPGGSSIKSLSRRLSRPSLTGLGIGFSKSQQQSSSSGTDDSIDKGKSKNKGKSRWKDKLKGKGTSQ